MPPKHKFTNRLTRTKYRRVANYLKNVVNIEKQRVSSINNITEVNGFLGPAINNANTDDFLPVDHSLTNFHETMDEVQINPAIIAPRLSYCSDNRGDKPEFVESNSSITFNASKFSEQLSAWAIKENITLSSLGKLVKILKSVECLNYLPNDPRTLLNTPVHYEIARMGAGSFFYFGVEKTIDYIIKKNNVTLSPHDCIDLSVNVDGLPLSKSTSNSFWPILCIISSIKYINKKVFLVGLYQGSEKPCGNELLQNFVNECKILTENGILINSVRHNFKVDSLICDAPAKSLVLNIKGHTGNFSCTKCTQEADFIDNVTCFLECRNIRKRTDQDFRQRFQPEHHHGFTILESLPNFDIINSVPLDYMHLLCLGVVKRLLCNKRFGWIHGKPPNKLRASSINVINNKLAELKKFIPSEFSRKTRSINEVKRYKATEFRTFLLYTGPIVMKNILSSKLYNHFITLSVASILLISADFSTDNEYVEYAEKLLIIFVEKCIELYGASFVTYNVHNLIHLADCVKTKGKLDNYSSFPFENFMQSLKRKVRKSNKSLEQIVRRTIEEQNLCLSHAVNGNNITCENKTTFSIEHFDGPIPQNCTLPQFKKMHTLNFCLNVRNTADSFVELRDDKIVEIKNFAFCNNSPVIIGYEYDRKQDFFCKPCKSSILNISIINRNEKSLHYWDVELIKRKVVILPYKENLVCFPLLHVDS